MSQPIDTELTRFRDYHAHNPEIYKLLVHFAKELRKTGMKHGTCGIGPVWERARWSTIIGEDGASKRVRMQNNYRPWYARLINRLEPDLKGFFKTKESQASIFIP